MQSAKFIVVAFLIIVLTALLAPFWIYTSVMMAKVILPTREFMVASGIHRLVWRFVFQAILLAITLGLMTIILGLVRTIDFSRRS
jgi:hypothetical protein